MGINPLSWFSSNSNVEERVENLEEDMDSLTKVVIENRGDISELDEEKADQEQIGKLEDLIYEELMERIEEISDEVENLSVKNGEEEESTSQDSVKSSQDTSQLTSQDSSQSSQDSVKEAVQNGNSRELLKMERVMEKLTETEKKILRYLLEGDWNRREDIARNLEISERTVSNYFSKLRDKGVDIEERRIGDKKKAYTILKEHFEEEEE